MTVHELLAYVPLAVWCNTAAGPPFEAVLLWFAARHPFPAAWVVIVVGSLCAGLAAALEAATLRLATRGRPSPAGVRFYVLTFLIALSPVPFTVARVAALKRRPKPWPYAAAVAAGRLPRYAAMVALWDVLSPPGWVLPIALGAAVLAMVVAALRRWGPGRRRWVDAVTRRAIRRSDAASCAALGSWAAPADSRR